MISTNIIDVQSAITAQVLRSRSDTSRAEQRPDTVALESEGRVKPAYSCPMTTVPSP
jgi:hypothetical protein